MGFGLRLRLGVVGLYLEPGRRRHHGDGVVGQWGQGRNTGNHTPDMERAFLRLQLQREFPERVKGQGSRVMGHGSG